MRTARAVLTATLAITAAIGAQAVVATPAGAARSDCDAGYFCLWYYQQYGSPMYVWRSGDNDHDYGSAIDNQSESAYNHSTYREVRAYRATRCSNVSGSWRFRVGESYSTMAGIGNGFNNNISSHCWI